VNSYFEREIGGDAMLDIKLSRPLTRVHSHIALGPMEP